MSMWFSQNRLRREFKTVAAMVDYYCHRTHGGEAGLCPECQALLDYAALRLARCPFQEAKPTCAHCAVHCYTAVHREKMKVVMQVAGPGMIWRHPILALGHVLDRFRPAPPHSPGRSEPA